LLIKEKALISVKKSRGKLACRAAMQVFIKK